MFNDIISIMWSIRMRASKTNAKCKMQNAKFNEEHISGAEGIYRESEITEKSREYINRALSHPRGMPDRVIITLDKVKEKPIKVPILPVNTLKCSSPDKAKEIIIQKLGSLGVSKKAIDNGLKILEAKKTMRGAALMLMESGRRKEPDRERGVRVSRLGIEKSVEKKLSRRLALKGINTITVKEALILASKVASCPDIVAEVCISDDPDYTTGYIASKGLGYLRIPNGFLNK
ncbi:MAG: hypothetical protein HY754_04980 [Nitrospirae bacterium]|nr:hypothetical protein [Nitrospirota bacterium]